MILVSHHCFSVSLWCPHWPGSHLLNANQHHCSLGRPLCHCEVLQDHTRRVGWVIWIILKSVFTSLKASSHQHQYSAWKYVWFSHATCLFKMMHKMADGWKENDNRIKKISRKHKFPGYSETQSSMLLTSACHKERKSSSVYMFSNSS